jgi:hypothetical protein
VQWQFSPPMASPTRHRWFLCRRLDSKVNSKDFTFEALC